MIEEPQPEVTKSSNLQFLDGDRTHTPARLIRLACGAHALAALLAECCDLCEWFGVSRTRATVQHWYQSYANHYEERFMTKGDHIAVDEMHVQPAEEQKVWLYAAFDVDSKVVRGARFSPESGN